MALAFLKVIGQKAMMYGSTFLTGSFVGYEIGSDISEPQESIENSNVGSENRHNYDSYFNVTFENGTTGIILVGVVIVVIVIVILGFFLYCCRLCCSSRRRTRNENSNGNERQLFKLMLRHNREQERKQDNRQNQELPNIESNYQEIIEEDKQKSNTYTQIPKTQTNQTKHDNKYLYQSKLENMYGTILGYMM